MHDRMMHDHQMGSKTCRIFRDPQRHRRAPCPCPPAKVAARTSRRCR
jgi:hypothetical protein